ncbi:MAG: hypothetical protein GF411_03055 [Candidatus Lokiarchaeota archaeon]|nr:hypothetical protein [Candidatus Lokiarchaeota archaeon]
MMNCPNCGTKLQKVVIFEEKVVQCPVCEYKQNEPTLQESVVIDKILEETT